VVIVSAASSYSGQGPVKPLTVATVIVALVLVASVAVGVWVYEETLPCTPPGADFAPGSHLCPVPPPPTPTTLIANGTVFTISAGSDDYFQFLLSPATFASLTGSFTTTGSAAVYVMSPGEFATFSTTNVTKFSCSATDSCFSTGVVRSGTVNISDLPVYRSQSNGNSIEPWFLVLQNGNSTAPTNVTWISGLVASYEDVYAVTPASPGHPSLTYALWSGTKSAFT
jgi:hypothetical protein